MSQFRSYDTGMFNRDWLKDTNTTPIDLTGGEDERSERDARLEAAAQEETKVQTEEEDRSDSESLTAGRRPKKTLPKPKVVVARRK